LFLKDKDFSFYRCFLKERFFFTLFVLQRKVKDKVTPLHDRKRFNLLESYPHRFEKEWTETRSIELRNGSERFRYRQITVLS
jgi:hypothetical protein